MNITRFLIRATGEEPWTDSSISRLWNEIEACLKAALTRGRFDFSNAAAGSQIVTELDVSYTRSPTSHDWL